MVFFSERFRNNGGRFFDPATMKATVNSEAGVTIYPHSRLGVSVGYNYRVLWFDRVTGSYVSINRLLVRKLAIQEAMDRAPRSGDPPVTSTRSACCNRVITSG